MPSITGAAPKMAAATIYSVDENDGWLQFDRSSSMLAGPHHSAEGVDDAELDTCMHGCMLLARAILMADVVPLAKEESLLLGNDSTFSVTSQDLADYLIPLLDGWVVSESEVLAARRTVKYLQAEYQNGRPAGRECVFEGLLRCRLTADIMSAFGVKKDKLPDLLNSSHTVTRHVCVAKDHDHVIPNQEWKIAFAQAIQRHGALVNIPVQGIQNPCRADLYFFASDGIVSLELKYIGPAQLLNVRNTVAQMRRYRHHKRSILVVYAAQHLHPGLEGSVRDVEDKLKRRGQKAKGLVVRGPEIARVGASNAGIR